LEKYANLFDIKKRIRFQTQVVSISKDDLKNEQIPWIVQTEIVTDGKKETYEFDFVVIATGLFSQPNIPTFKGQHRFSGIITNPQEIKSIEQLENKDVLVIGCGKCATDMTVLASKYARSCHMLFRRAHWMLPRQIVSGFLPVRILFIRALSTIYPPIPNAPCGFLLRFLHEKFPSLFMKISEGIGNDIMSIHGPEFSEDKIFIPQHPLRNIENVAMISSDFVQLKRQHRFTSKLATIDEILDGKTVRLNTGEELQADIIIAATGFSQQFPFFSEKDLQSMGLREADGSIQLNLYRRVVPVGIPNIAFVGHVASTAYWTIAEITSHWISDYFLKRLKLPKTKDEMYREIQENGEFIVKIFNRNVENYRYYWINLIEIYLNDIGVDLHRTTNWISEYFGIYRPERIKGLHEERKIIFLTGKKPTHFYLSFKLTIFIVFFLFFIYLFFF